jgi:hypothetical protein
MIRDATYNTTGSLSMTVFRWEVCCAICRLRSDCMTWAANLEQPATCYIMSNVGKLMLSSASGTRFITGRVYR